MLHVYRHVRILFQTACTTVMLLPVCCTRKCYVFLIPVDSRSFQMVYVLYILSNFSLEIRDLSDGLKLCYRVMYAKILHSLAFIFAHNIYKEMRMNTIRISKACHTLELCA